MQIWLDTIDYDVLKNAKQIGVLYGVTTNPSLLAASQENPQKVIESILEIQDGPVAIQVTQDDAKSMLKQAITRLKTASTNGNNVVLENKTSQ